MPQYTACVRCGSILPGSNFPIDIEPPRAGRIEKQLRLAIIIYALNRIAALVTFCFGWIWDWLLALFQVKNRSANLTILGLFWKGILPGLPQWYYGRTPHDWHFFFGWLVLMLFTFLTLGLTASGFLLGAAIMCHLASIIDISILLCVERRDRLILFAIMTISAALIFYVPTSAVWRILLGVQWVNTNVGPLQVDDSLLYTRLRITNQPQVGKLVLYRTPHVMYSSTGGEEPNHFLTGDMFDLVLAVEGQRITWKEGELTIDGKVPTCQPFTPLPQLHPPPDATFVVPEGHCYIVPSAAFQTMAMPKREDDWQAMGLVPYQNVYGVIWAVRRSFFEFVDISVEK
jgi:hypothetical protein